MPVTRIGHPESVDEETKSLILSVSERHRSQGFYYGLGIPEKKAANARLVCRVPPEESILGLLDFSLFGSAKECALLTDTGIFFVTDIYSFSNRGVQYFSYDSFVKQRIGVYRHDDNTVVVGGKEFYAAVHPSRTMVVNLLADLKRSLLAAKAGVASKRGAVSQDRRREGAQSSLDQGWSNILHDVLGVRSSPSAVLPHRTWSPVNVAVADMNAYTLSASEVKTLTEKLHSALVSTDYFSVLSRSDMKEVLEAQAFQPNYACDDTACLIEMGQILSVQKIIGGTLGRVGSTFSLSLRFVDVETGKTELSINDQWRGEPDGLLVLVEDAVRMLAVEYADKLSDQNR